MRTYAAFLHSARLSVSTSMLHSDEVLMGFRQRHDERRQKHQEWR